MSTQKELLRELVYSRDFIFSQIADLAEEEGKPYLCRAWRWLQKFRKFPSLRSKNKWGWSFNITTLAAASKGGPTILPRELLMLKLIKSTPLNTEEEALEAAAEALAKLFKEIDDS